MTEYVEAIANEALKQQDGWAAMPLRLLTGIGVSCPLEKSAENNKIEREENTALYPNRKPDEQGSLLL